MARVFIKRAPSWWPRLKGDKERGAAEQQQDSIPFRPAAQMVPSCAVSRAVSFSIKLSFSIKVSFSFSFSFSLSFSSLPGLPLLLPPQNKSVPGSVWEAAGRRKGRNGMICEQGTCGVDIKRQKKTAKGL